MDHFPIIPVGLEQEEAFGWMIDLLDRFDERYMVMKDDRAVGIIALLGIEPHHEIHYVPFSWATDRNVLEAAVSFLDRLRRSGKWAMMYCERGGKDHAFLTTLERTGIVRRTGTLLYHPTGPKATFEVKMLGEGHVA